MYRVIMGTFFRLVGLFVPVDDRLILISSFMGKSFNDSPKVLYDSIRNNEKYKEYRCVWAFEDPSRFPEVESVKIDTWAYFKTALSAKYWITNTNIERGLKFKKKSQRYLNTWHGIALKTIGNDCPGRKDYDFSNIDYMIVSGAHDEKVFRSAFRVNPSSFLKCGMPRNERLWRATSEDTRAMREKLSIPEGKKAILYAPTWRESLDGGKTYAIKPPIHFDKWKEALGDRYIVLFRAHHQTTKIMGVAFDDFVRDVSEYPDVNDLMIAADVLVTDYSSIAFDYSILRRAIVCYAYDYDSYLANRGVYFDMNTEYPNPICREEKELIEALQKVDPEKEAEKTTQFRDKFIQYRAETEEQCIRALLKD